jgi:hypothetical protein
MGIAPYDLVVSIEKFDETELTSRMDEIAKLRIKPDRLILLNNTKSFDHQYKIGQIIRRVPGLKFDIETIIDEEANTTLLALNYAARRVTSPFFINFMSNSPIENEDIEQLDTYLNDNRVLMAKADDYHGLMFRTNVFNHVGGSSQTNVIDKITLIATEEDRLHQILESRYEPANP